ncbi:hypothetical protein PV326_001403, partial [Microctonus aethiopoides]
MGRHVFCVPFCLNSSINSKCTFYSFPGAIKRPEQLKKWIAAVRIMYSDRSEWKPSNNDKICSDHFVGNRKSVVPNNPGYIPKIFPTQYKNKKVNYEQVLNRYNRNVKRCQSAINRQSVSNNLRNPTTSEKLLSPKIVPSNEMMQIAGENEEVVQCENSFIGIFKQMDKECQVYIIDENEAYQNILKETFSCNTYNFSDRSQYDAAIQTQITVPKRVKIISNNCSEKKYNSKKCGTLQKTYADIATVTDDDDSVRRNRSFSGFVSIENDQELLDLAGVTYHNFKILLTRMTDSEHKLQISKEDRLLIFL